jgi:uncharacterized SAM-binding protein YcdF (DUF218 family)
MRYIPATRLRRIVAVLVVLFVAFAVFSMLLFVFPAVNTPERSDAIIVLGGSGQPTERAGVQLAAQHLAPALVFSLRPDQTCRPSSVSVAASGSVQVTCFHATPQTTQGEARAIAALAKVHHWHRIIVVAPTSQVTRARLRVTRCYSGQVLMDGVSTGNLWQWTYAVAYEWGALTKALVVQRNC